MRVSRPQDLHTLAALDITGKAIFALLAVKREGRQLVHAAFLHFGNDKIMSRIAKGSARDGFEFVHSSDDSRIHNARPARDGGEISLSRGR